MSELAPFSMSSPEAVGDPERLDALDSYDILDTPPEEGFDEIVHLAALACDVPIALVSFVAENRQWFKARIGFPPCETDLSSSVCAHALTEPDLLIISDLTADPRTARNPLVTDDPHIRFYAGAPLRNGRGQVLGSLCVIDKAPRPHGLTHTQADMLRGFARQVMAMLELRRSVVGRDVVIARRRRLEQRLGEDRDRLQISEAHWRGLFEKLSEGFVIAELVRDDTGRVTDWRYLDVNAAWSELVGLDPEDVVGHTIREVLPGVEEEWVDELARVVETHEPAVFTRQVGSLQRWYEGRAFPLDGDRFAVLFVEVTERVRAEIRRNALLEIGDQLRELTTMEEMTAKASAIVGQALDATRVGFGQLDRDGEYVTIEPDWTAAGVPSIAGRHRFDDFGDIRNELLLGEPLIVRDARTDPRTANGRERWEAAEIRALVNIPIQERGRTVGVFLVHDIKPRAWMPETISFLRNVADRLMASVARLKAEADQRLLNQELSHRMKNMMAMAQAITSQTLKGLAEHEAVAVLQQRLLALSSAHDVLLQQNWAASSIRSVVDTSLKHFCEQQRFDISGPEVKLGSRSTLSLSLLVHELMTNALKYGSLSVSEGRVVVTWRIEGGTTPTLVFTWQEQGGPPAIQPNRKGFGSRLIGAGLVGSGGVALSYTTAGFSAEMRADLDQVQHS